MNLFFKKVNLLLCGLIFFSNGQINAYSFLNNQSFSTSAAVRLGRSIAQVNEGAELRLIPQEDYGEAVLDMIERKGKAGVTILQFNYFTDNEGVSYPKRIAQKVIETHQKFPQAPIVIALESKKEPDNPKGPAQRNSKTKGLFASAGIIVNDVFGQKADLQTPPGKDNGVSHTKLVMVGDEVLAGSNNLTKQSTDIGANNEMNLSVRSEKIAAAVRSYVSQIISNPGQMVDLEVEDGSVKLLTDRLHFNELINQIKLSQKGDQIGLSMYQFLYRNEKDQEAKQVFEELIAAHRRGVELEVYLNRAEDIASQNTDTNLKIAEAFLQEGITKVYFDPEAKISHSKYFYRQSAKEKVAIISSVNIYRGDFNNNHQMTWVVKDHPVIDQLTSYFKHQVAYDGVLVSRIPRDGTSGLRYGVSTEDPKKTIWNNPIPETRMLRVWRGYKQDNISSPDFENNVNSRLIPETIYVGAGRGLKAYLPSFYSGDNKPEFLPDEIAIIDYESAEKYNAIRSTVQGKKYGPLHFEAGLFAKQNSRGFSSGSLLAIPLSSSAGGLAVEVVPEGRAYQIGPVDLNWQSGVTLRRTLFIEPNSNNLTPTIQEYISSLQKLVSSNGINGAVVIVDPKYLILMLNLKNSESSQTLESIMEEKERGVFKKYDSTLFNNQKIGNTRMTSGAGINVLFDAALKPLLMLKKTISSVTDLDASTSNLPSVLRNKTILPMSCKNLF